MKGERALITVSLCMIVKDEEETLPRCLASVEDLVEEVILADTGSGDRTRQLGEERGARVLDFPWEEDFSAARNFAFSQATQDYCLWLDADDVLLPEDRRKFLQLKETLSPDTDVVMLPYHAALDERGRPALTYWRERLLRRQGGFRWEGAVHEAIAPRGKVVWGDAAVTHKKAKPRDPGRNLRILEKVRGQRGWLTPREQFYYGRELLDLERPREAAQALEGFLLGGQGWEEDRRQACLDLSRAWQSLGEEGRALEALTQALGMGVPRPELCCQLGDWYFRCGQWQGAAFWYQAALTCPEGGFSRPQCRGYYPSLQLCLCWYRLGDLERSRAWNRRAAAFDPESQVCRANEEFFAQALGR